MERSRIYLEDLARRFMICEWLMKFEITSTKHQYSSLRGIVPNVAEAIYELGDCFVAPAALLAMTNIDMNISCFGFFRTQYQLNFTNKV